MQAISLSSLVLLPGPRSGNLLRRRTPFVSAASKRDAYGHHHNYGGKLVDENMIILRMRIREIEMVDMKTNAPSDWTEWEKNYLEHYGSDVCEAVGMLQRLLMNMRPGLAVGMLALVMMSMTMSMSMLVFHLVELAKGITSSYNF
ncbi:uncharacterized protein LOC130716933 [Lotus japonicus]|uniref:uncharacterized protein LOC130716933 n=1 Tax=Lotus japonicus TaxID=34305 RepID=UPI00258B1B77|nr:uncharacterized protein LOC130716933 [Lotus japonicus]